MNQLLHIVLLWDERTILSIIARRGFFLNRLMKFLSVMGDGYLWIAVSLAIFFLTDAPLPWLMIGITAFALELVLYKIIKQSTSRKRPCHANLNIQNLVVPQDQYSFPSGHTAAATVAALLFSTAVPALMPLFFFLALMIGLSRVYLGVHYPTDVLMGCCLGVFSFAVSYSIF